MTLITTHLGPPRAIVQRSSDSRRSVGFATVRRILQVALGLLWLLDAALQFQPYMFTRAFVTQTLGPASRGNPAVIAQPMHWVFHLIAAQPAIANSVFAAIQLLIASGLFWRRTVKAALALSVVWSLGVWWFGEGLGGVLNGG